MQKVSYIGDGVTTEFFFNFPFFETSNVVVTVNNEPATAYSIVGTSAGMDADIPYTGGKVVFEVAPTALDCITIARQLPLERIVDYQPLSKIDPTTLNQDLNYLMEVIKDRKDELNDLTTKYAEIADKESTEIILARISAIHEEIVDIDAKIQALGDISTLRQDVNDLTTTVGGHTASIGDLNTSVGVLNTTVSGHTTSIDGLNTQKSNIDMDNLSNTGKNEIARLSMPSGRKVDLTLGATGAEYTAPADGWIVWNGRFNTTSGYLTLTALHAKTGVNANAGNPTGTACRCYAPATKGRPITCNYKDIKETYDFLFVYAEGAQ